MCVCVCVCVCVCFLSNIYSKTWPEISEEGESKIKNTKLSSLRGGASAGTQKVVEGQNCLHPVWEVRALWDRGELNHAPALGPSLFPVGPAGSECEKSCSTFSCSQSRPEEKGEPAARAL